jgi:hypothetical protein
MLNAKGFGNNWAIDLESQYAIKPLNFVHEIVQRNYKHKTMKLLKTETIPCVSVVPS